MAAGTTAISALPLHRGQEPAVGVLVVYHGPQEKASVCSAAATRQMAEITNVGLLVIWCGSS
ncbi:MAG: hypothetical protein EOO77_23250 [Oxalobacteraceae bacterium]|nr:MAG: hypothetical protein EOO77_23250 [Oxalobacteraceae bacterium]